MLRFAAFLALIAGLAILGFVPSRFGTPKTQNPTPASQPWPQTKPERTNYAETSSYADVMAFLDELIRKGAPMRIETIGKSTEGKDMPLVVCARDPKITPEQARERGMLVAYVQANIHAGEVEGKESVLMLLREIAQNPKHFLLDNYVLVTTPIYNIDGNEKFGPQSRNRPSQDGPDPVGQRANGQGLDLNRDCMKAESPEMRAVLEHVYANWNPDIVMDLHTTNGTRHGYVLSYSPALNPAADQGVFKFTRDELLMKIRREFPKKYRGWQLFDYGNAEGEGANRHWATFEEKPRYVSNYGGIRNRVTVLSEAASFQPFKVRVDSTLAFVKEVLSECALQKQKIKKLISAADKSTAALANSANNQVGIRFDFESRGNEKVILEVAKPTNPVPRNKAPKELELVEMPVFDRFKATRTARMPETYYFARGYSRVARLLMRHGVTVERVGGNPVTEPVESFVVSECKVAQQAFQGHKLVTLEGKWQAAEVDLPPRSFKVSTAQPLGYLVFHMLEPESLDGAIAWGFFGEKFEVGSTAPIYKSLPR